MLRNSRWKVFYSNAASILKVSDCGRNRHLGGKIQDGITARLAVFQAFASIHRPRQSIPTAGDILQNVGQ